MELEPCPICSTKPTFGCWACAGAGKIEAVDQREIAPALIGATTPSRAGASNPAHQIGGPDVLVSVDAPHFNAGIILRDDVVIQAAPILRWTIGKTRDELRAYFQSKGWRVYVHPDS